MYQAARLTFFYAVTPVHMGAGSAIGAIDAPIQREVHTDHPVFAGSGLKGALRHHFNRAWPGEKDKKSDGLIGRIFGPETNASDFAGALALSDAQLVALPVRSLKNAFVYGTCPLALARVRRLADFAKVPVDWAVPEVAPGHALLVGDRLLAQGRLVLEAFEFQKADGSIGNIADWLAGKALPGDEANKPFAEKLRNDLVVLSDDDFTHFARHAMVVEPHVRIDDDSGTADDGGLFYTENLPPESILAGLVLASVERVKGERNDRMDAGTILKAVFDGDGTARPGVADKLLQIGGDATVGRGLVLVHPVGAEARS